MKKLSGIISAVILLAGLLVLSGLSGWIWASKNRALIASDALYSPNTGTTPVIIFVALGVIAIALFIFIRRRK